MKKILLFFSMALMPILTIQSQNEIDRLDALYGEHSIVHELSLDKWIVYSDTGQSFSLVEEGSSQVNVIDLPNEFTSISDFTIFNYCVYFCGMRDTTPVMGYFSILAFTDTTSSQILHYSKMTGVDTLTAIKVYETDFAQQRPYPFHVIMLGEKNGVGILVEALTLMPGPGWDTYYITLLTKHNETVRHNDIGLLDNFVVVASHNNRKPEKDDPLYRLGTGYIWYISKPTNSSYPPLAMPKYFTIPNIVPSKPLKLAACEDAACVAAAHAYRLINGQYFPGIHVYGYNYPSNINTVRIVDDSIKEETLKGLCYDKTMKKTELLLQYNSLESSKSYIYTLTHTTYPWSTLYGRVYENDKINSLTTREYGSELFVGSGINTTDGSGLYLYFYENTGNTIICANGATRKLEDVDRMQLIDGSRTFDQLTHPDSTATLSKYTVKKNIICKPTK